MAGLLIFLIAAIYTNIPIKIGSLSIEGGYALIPGLIFFALTVGSIGKRFKPLMFIVLLPLIPTLLGFLRGLQIAQGVQAYVGLAASICAAYGVSEIIARFNRDFVARILLIFSILIVIALIMELYLGLGFISDHVRKFLYEGRFVYDADVRDIRLYGHVRAKAFAQEPSGPARFLAYIPFCVIVLSTNLRKKLIAGAAIILAFVMISSPSIYACAILFIYLIGVALVKAKPRLRPFAAPVLIATVIATALMVSNVEFIATFIGGERGQLIAAGQDTSTTMRVLIPPKLASHTVSTLGPFGAGMGAKELLQPIARPIFRSYRGGKWMVDGDGLFNWSSAFFDVFIYLGPIFGILFLALIPFVFRLPIFGGSLVMFMSVFLLDGGLAGPRNWLYFGLLVAAARMGPAVRRKVRRRGGWRPLPPVAAQGAPPHGMRPTSPATGEQRTGLPDLRRGNAQPI